MGPHGQFACLGGSGYLPCSQIEVDKLLKTAENCSFQTISLIIFRFLVGTTLTTFVQTSPRDLLEHILSRQAQRIRVAIERCTKSAPFFYAL